MLQFSQQKCCICKYKEIEGEGWTKSLRGFKISPTVWSNWLSNGDGSIGLSGRTDTTKAYKFFREGYIHQIVTIPNFIKARCYRSMKKNEEPHYLIIQFIAVSEGGDSNVVAAHCLCKAGNEGHCNT